MGTEVFSLTPQQTTKRPQQPGGHRRVVVAVGVKVQAQRILHHILLLLLVPEYAAHQCRVRIVSIWVVDVHLPGPGHILRGEPAGHRVQIPCPQVVVPGLPVVVLPTVAESAPGTGRGALIRLLQSTPQYGT